MLAISGFQTVSIIIFTSVMAYSLRLTMQLVLPSEEAEESETESVTART